MNRHPQGSAAEPYRGAAPTARRQLATTEAALRTVVIVPTYNEAENILTMVEAIMASEIAPDVLVVDDSSPDGTGALVTEAAAQYQGRLHLLTRPGKQGIGAAYRAGF